MQKTTTPDLACLLDEIRKNAVTCDREAIFPEKSIAALAKAGYLGLLVPEKLGGMQADFSCYLKTVMEIASACASTGMIFVMHNCGITAIKELMQPESAEPILRAAARGEHLSTLCLSERATGIHVDNSMSSSSRKNGSYLLNAEKVFVTSGGHADSYVVTTRAVGVEEASKTSFFLVEKGNSGQTFKGRWEGLGLRGNSSCNMSLVDCLVPADHLLGVDGEGLKYSHEVLLPRFLSGSAAVYTGIGKAALDAACKHVKERSHAHLAQSLAEQPTIRLRIAEMKLAVDLCLNMLLDLGRSFDSESPEQDLGLKLMEAKVAACKMAKEVSGLAMQVCGGIAYSGAVPIERYLRDSYAGSVMAPSVDALLDLIGQNALDMQGGK